MTLVTWFACGNGSFAFAVRGEEVRIFDPLTMMVVGWYRVVSSRQRAAQSGNMYLEYSVELPPGVELWEGNTVSSFLQRLPDGPLQEVSVAQTWSELDAPQEVVRVFFPQVGEQLDATAQFRRP